MDCVRSFEGVRQVVTKHGSDMTQKGPETMQEYVPLQTCIPKALTDRS